MKSLLLTITTKSPLIVTDELSQGMNHKTLTYIPGNMLLGTFANIWKKKVFKSNEIADNDERFQNLFLNGKVQWGCAYPSSRKGQISVPIPLCYQKLKNHGGLPLEGTDAEACVYNPLRFNNPSADLKNLYQTRYKEEFENNHSTPKPKKIDIGFMVNEEKPHRIEVPKNWFMHVALGQQRSALESKLFGYNSIATGTKFISEIFFEETCEKELLELLTLGTKETLHLGAAKHAGYGFADCKFNTPSALTANKISSKEITLFFTSDYIPPRIWDSPIDGLNNEIASNLNISENEIKIDLKKVFTQSRNVDGFNCTWNLPRTTQSAFLKGSVIGLTVNADISAQNLPVAFGSRQNEGYGRFMINPCFLEKFETFVTGPQDKTVFQDDTSAVKALDSSPLLNLLRQRCLQRIVKENSLKFTYCEKVNNFILSAAKNKQPSQNQRANLRLLFTSEKESSWSDFFKDKLKKTPGKQWKDNTATSPFNGVRDYLSEIMSKLINRDEFEKLISSESLDAKTITLLGNAKGALTNSEKEFYLTQMHKACLLEILNRWEKEQRKANNSSKETK